MIAFDALHLIVRPQDQRNALVQGFRHDVQQPLASRRCAATRLLEVIPESLHQRVPLILGSYNEVQRIERYHAEHACGADRPYSSPLFNERSMFRPEARL